jgi:hypothetical protein
MGVKGDTTGQLKATLMITNVSQGNLAYKVKTTAPRQYVVKPNQGIIDIGQKFAIDISLIQSPVRIIHAEHTLRTTKSKTTSS